MVKPTRSIPKKYRVCEMLLPSGLCSVPVIVWCKLWYLIRLRKGFKAVFL